MTTDKKTYARRTPRPQNLTIYLGVEEERIPRIEALDRLAAKFTDGNRSALIAAIADGKLTVVAPRD